MRDDKPSLRPTTLHQQQLPPGTNVIYNSARNGRQDRGGPNRAGAAVASLSQHQKKGKDGKGPVVVWWSGCWLKPPVQTAPLAAASIIRSRRRRRRRRLLTPPPPPPPHTINARAAACMFCMYVWMDRSRGPWLVRPIGARRCVFLVSFRLIDHLTHQTGPKALPPPEGNDDERIRARISDGTRKVGRGTHTHTLTPDPE
jgi:hypothetical protein